ncbi:amidohydrolase family protein [Chloroflexota bacterium]
MIIDVFAHILPKHYLDERNKRAESSFKATQYSKLWSSNPALIDLDTRFSIMDKYEDYLQVLTIAGPNVESISKSEDAIELCRIANDEMAELVLKYPDRFVSAIACIPMSDMDAALRETDRAINDLKFRGVEIFTDVNGKPVDSPEFIPLYEKMTDYNLPVLLHPRRENKRADYPGEAESRYLVYNNLGWPFETSAAMTRIAVGGVFERYPALKVITHHAGGMIPYFSKRIELAYDFYELRMGFKYETPLTKKPLDYYRMFYNDTAIQGNAAALMCAYDFFGAGHMLFGTDFPWDSQLGHRMIRETLQSVELMDIPSSEKQMIYEDNARKLLRLPI